MARIAGINIPQNKVVSIALTYIHGIGPFSSKKICKKLRLRNYPSIALFINGDKIDTWKGDMDGVIEIEPSDIKDAIENALAGDQY